MGFVFGFNSMWRIPWVVLPGCQFAHGTRYATICVRLLSLMPSREIYNYLVADVTDLGHPCDDRMSHGRRSRHLVGRRPLSGIQTGVGPRVLVLPVAYL